MLIDISPIIDKTIDVWPGDTPFVQTVNVDMNAGGNLTLSDIRTSVHVGAHADAPSHYVANGADIAARRLDFYLGRCVVVHVNVARVGWKYTRAIRGGSPIVLITPTLRGWRVRGVHQTVAACRRLRVAVGA